MNRIPVENFKFPIYSDEDVIRSWKWFMSFVSEKGWPKRKAKIEQKLSLKFRTSPPFSDPLTEGTLIVDREDTIGWYLYLVDMLINEPHKYEYFQGSRVVPIFKRIGIDLELLKKIKGIEKRVRDLINRRRHEADALLFEILTALLWVKNGYDVSFIEEKAGQKTPDILAEKEGKVWNIECKRQSKTSDYSYGETEKRQKMISYIGELLLKHNIILDIVFHVGLEKLPDTYLRDLLTIKLKLAIAGKLVSNEIVDIDVSFVDIPSVKRHLQKYFVKQNSPMLNSLIGNKPIGNKEFSCGYLGAFYHIGEGEVNNVYVSDIQNACAVYWTCDAKEAISAKARNVKNQIKKAIEQFNSKDTAVIHIGMETFDGPIVEKVRIEKIKETLLNLDRKEAKLDWIYLHFFQAYSLPDEEWTFDETVSILSTLPKAKSPIPINLMIVPGDEDIMDDIFHWERPMPK